MSKINMDTLKEAIGTMLTTKKERKFVETVELQVMLKVHLNLVTLLNRITILKRIRDLLDP